ncbi:hypothetical protein NQ318_003276 [Aromia moschata]|uniref:Sorting nexin-13 n=1 Tax=Aromia moschata TaxID=1265417 RepID=A0AAV8YL61_9CUCU|nr:hypothetical protein NQ318_003276 [Aromia moschata]
MDRPNIYPFYYNFRYILASNIHNSCFIIYRRVFSLLYVQQGDIEKFYTKCAGNPLTSAFPNEGGMKQVVKQLESPKKVQKTDSRVTGSELIDSSLQEILGYIVRDYVSSWYNLISRDTEFTEVSLRHTAQTFAINVSNRIKDVDWIPYLTQRLVDDAASHLRLYKQARTKMKHQEAIREQKNSPQRDTKSPKKSIHKRNKSETDVTWYSGRTTELKKRNLDNEKEFLSELVEVLLYILLPHEDFQCKPLRFVLREIFANYVILPLFDLISDPDYINQTIIWLCLRDAQLPTEIFLTTLRLTDNCDELKSTKEEVSREIHTLRSRDSGGESDLSIKQQLNSLYYVLKLIDTKLSKMENKGSLDIQSSLDIQLDTVTKIDLTLVQILKNNIALSYFMDFISSLGKQVDLFLYLNIEGWRVSVEQQISEIHLNKAKMSAENVTAAYDTIRSTALGIYEQYLGENSEQKVEMKQSLVQPLYFKIRNLNETPSEVWFDKILDALYDKMENEFLPPFKESKAYIKLLQELDLLQQTTTEDDILSINSNDSLENDAGKVPDNLPQVGKKSDFLLVDSTLKSVKHARSFSDVTVFTSQNAEPRSNSVGREDKMKGITENQNKDMGRIDERSLKVGNYALSVNIIETGIVCEKGKTFGIYAVRVTRQYDTGYQEEWHIYRRYSDFHDLYTKFPDLSKLAFPGKKTFHNMDRSVLERRMKMLGYYMHELCQPHVISTHHTLKELLMTFLEQGEYDRATGGPISSTIDTLVNPLKSGMKTIKNMPEQFINTVDEVVVGLSKVFHAKPGRLPEASKVGASIEENDDNIPLRIMLLLMDEVFDLKSRNQWLRRRIVTLLRQIVRTMFAPKNVAHYLYTFKQSFWPNGVRNDKKSERDDDMKNKTRVAAKVALLSCLSDELKHIIGSETTRRGLLMVFDHFQRPILNRRLLYVLLEGVLCTLFPDKDMEKLFIKLYSKSKKTEWKDTHKPR